MNGKIKESYQDVKHTLDWLAEIRGEGYTCLQVYSLLASKLGVTGVTDEGLETLRLAVEQEFLAHPPIVLQETIDALQQLRDAGFTLSIGSNSNFISGSTMYPWLQKTFGDFEFGVFSDLEETAKPNSVFFDKIANLAYNQRKIIRKQIIHVGDNTVCDVRGAKDAYMIPWFCNAVTDIPSIVAQILEGK
jgi:putative hydrolase of the HAD superfamily